MSSVSTTLVRWCTLNCKYLREIFEKNWNCPIGILRGLGETNSWKNLKLKIPWHFLLRLMYSKFKFFPFFCWSPCTSTCIWTEIGMVHASNCFVLYCLLVKFILIEYWFKRRRRAHPSRSKVWNVEKKFVKRIGIINKQCF